MNETLQARVYMCQEMLSELKVRPAGVGTLRADLGPGLGDSSELFKARAQPDSEPKSSPIPAPNPRPNHCPNHCPNPHPGQAHNPPHPPSPRPNPKPSLTLALFKALKAVVGMQGRSARALPSPDPIPNYSESQPHPAGSHGLSPALALTGRLAWAVGADVVQGMHFWQQKEA